MLSPPFADSKKHFLFSAAATIAEKNF